MGLDTYLIHLESYELSVIGLRFLNVEITGICYLCPTMFSFLLIYFVILYMVFLENCPLHKESVDSGDVR